jgi:hypothetical protein
MTIKKLTICHAVAMIFCALPVATAQAQERHDIRLAWMLGARGNYGLASHTTLSYIGDLDNTAQEPRAGATTWLSFTLDYAYRVNHWFSVGCSVAWTAGICNLYYHDSNKRWDTKHVDYISLLPTARFTWLRRSIVELYSSLGATAGIEHWVHYNGGKQHTYRPYLSYDIKPIGIAVGRKWYGFAEAGYGARGIFNIGVGHRF